MSVHQEKALKIDLRKNLSELEVLSNEISVKQKYALDIQKKVDDIRAAIDSLARSKKKGLHISDHAIVRYIERVLGVDLKIIEDKILTDNIRQIVDKLGGNGEFTLDEFHLVIKDNVVVTIIPNGK